MPPLPGELSIVEEVGGGGGGGGGDGGGGDGGGGGGDGGGGEVRRERPKFKVKPTTEGNNQSSLSRSSLDRSGLN